MPSFVSVEFKTDLADGLAKLEKHVSDKVLYSGAAAMARVIYDEVLINVSGVRPRTPKIVTGNLYRGIYWAAAKEENDASPNRKTYKVSWNHAKAPHGHLLEFGHKGAPAYPFMRPAASKLPDALKVGRDRMRVRFKELGGV